MQISNWLKKKISSHKHWLFFQKMDGIRAESELELVCASKTWLKRRKCVGKIRKGQTARGEGEAMRGADGLKQNSFPFSAPSLNPHTLFSFLQPSQNIHRRRKHLPRAIFLLFLSLWTLYSKPSSLFLISYNKARIQPNGRHRELPSLMPCCYYSVQIWFLAPSCCLTPLIHPLFRNQTILWPVSSNRDTDLTVVSKLRIMRLTARKSSTSWKEKKKHGVKMEKGTGKNAPQLFCFIKKKKFPTTESRNFG